MTNCCFQLRPASEDSVLIIIYKKMSSDPLLEPTPIKFDVQNIKNAFKDIKSSFQDIKTYKQRLEAHNVGI